MKVYLSEYIDPAAVAYLRERAEIVDNFDHPEEIDAIILRNIPVTAERMDACKNLKVIGMELGGKALGQIGMGNIAQRIAKILRDGFGCRTGMSVAEETL